MFFLFTHVVLHLDRFLFLLPDLFSSPYSYIWMISIIVFWTICSLFIIIIQFQHANKCFLFLFIKFFWAFMLRSTIHLPPIEEGEFLLCYVKDFRQRIASSFQKELHPSDHTNPYGQHAVSYPDIPSWQTVTWKFLL